MKNGMNLGGNWANRPGFSVASVGWAPISSVCGLTMPQLM